MPVRIVDADRFRAVLDRGVGLVLRRVSCTEIRQRRSTIARRRRALEAELREPDSFVVFFETKRFGAGREILVRDAEHRAAVGLFLRELRDALALSERRTEQETTHDAADHDADHASLLPD